LISESARRIIAEGGITIRVRRSGMLQNISFTVRKVRLGSGEFTEIYTKKVIDMSELQRVAKETGLPVEAENGRAFPDGMGANDFILQG